MARPAAVGQPIGQFAKKYIIYLRTYASRTDTMVRHKSRWILARFDFEPDVAPSLQVSSEPKPGSTVGVGDSIVPRAVGAAKKRKRDKSGAAGSASGDSGGAGAAASSSPNPNALTGKDIHKSLRDCMAAAFGTVGAALTYDVHGEKNEKVPRQTDPRGWRVRWGDVCGGRWGFVLAPVPY